MYGGRHDGISFAAISIDEATMYKQAMYYMAVIGGYLRNDPLPFAAGTEASTMTNRLRFKRNVTFSDCVDDLRELALYYKGVYDAHHNGEPEWRHER